MVREEFVERWSARSISSALRLLEGKSGVTAPFGETEGGHLDLRGIKLDQVLTISNRTLERIDFSYSEFARAQFRKTSLSECRFDSSLIQLQDLRSIFFNVSFVAADMRGSSFGHRISTFRRCDFHGSDLRGVSGSRAKFEQCNFSSAQIRNSMMGNSLFERCVFDGIIRKCIFNGGAGGGFRRCDLSNVHFLDCGFVNLEFQDCTFSSEVIHFTEWSKAFTVFNEKVKASSALADNEKLGSLREAWKEGIEFTRSQLVDKKDLIEFLGDDVGEEVFQVFRSLDAS